MRGPPRTLVWIDTWDVTYMIEYGVAYMRHCGMVHHMVLRIWGIVHRMVQRMLCEAWYIRWCGVAPNYDCSYAVGGSRGQMAVRGVKIFIQKPASFGFVSDMVANHGVLFQVGECIILSLKWHHDEKKLMTAPNYPGLKVQWKLIEDVPYSSLKNQEEDAKGSNAKDFQMKWSILGPRI